MRWDNLLLLLILALVFWALRQFVIVLSMHGPELRDLYERTFSPVTRPILELELLILAIALLVCLRNACRRR